MSLSFSIGRFSGWATTLTGRRWLRLLAVGSCALLLLTLYLRYTFVVGVNHDEVEHLHVGVRLVDGQIPYRDFYQNHWPAYWLVTTRLVQWFPFSVGAVLAGRALNLLALAGTALFGLRLLFQVIGGRTWFGLGLYLWTVVVGAFYMSSHVARPDTLMALFAVAALCLIPARGRLSKGRSFLIGILFGLAASISTKIGPIGLVVPALLGIYAVRHRSTRPVGSLMSYGFGGLLGLLPSVAWIWKNGLLEDFYFDVFGLNMATSKPFLDSFMFLSVTTYMASAAGALAWLSRYRRSGDRDLNGPLVLFLTLSAGVLLSLISRQGFRYDIQVLVVPLAVGFSSLILFLWFRIRGLGARWIMVAALIGTPMTLVGARLIRIETGELMPLADLQRMMDSARPGGKSCVGFSPSHPVFCRSQSQLANGWDVDFPNRIVDRQQLDRFHQIWQQAILGILEQPPDLLVRRDYDSTWELARDRGLISAEQLVALDALEPLYDVHGIGVRELWVLRDSSPR